MTDPRSAARERLSAILRRAKDAGTRFQHAVQFLMYEARQGSPHSERRWLVGYHSGLLLEQVMGDAECLIPLVNEEQVEDCERVARTVYEALRARRLASKLEQVEGRTPEEAAAFQEKARRLRSV